MKKSGIILAFIILSFLLVSSFPGIQADIHVEYERELIDSDTGSGFTGGAMHGLDMGRHHVFYDETYGYWYAFCLWGDGVYTNQRLRYWSTREYNGTWTRQEFISASVRGSSGSGNARNTAYTFDTYWEPGRRRVHIAYYLEDLGAYYRYGVPQSDGTLDLSGQRRAVAQSSSADACGRVSVCVASDLHPWVWVSLPVGYTNIVARCRDTDGVYNPAQPWKASQWAAVGWDPIASNYWYPHIVPVGEDGEVYAFAQSSDSLDSVVYGSIFNGSVMWPMTVTVTDDLCMKWYWTNNYYFSLFSVISWNNNPNARSSDRNYLHFAYKNFESGQRDGNIFVKNYTRSTNTWGAEVKIDDDDDYYSIYGFSLSIHLTGINPPSSETGLWLSVEFAACVDGTGWYEFDYLEYYEGSWDATRNFVTNQSRGDSGIYYPLGTGSYSAHWYSIVNGSIPFVWTWPLGGEGMPLYGFLLSTDLPLGVEIYVFEPEIIDPDLGLSPWVFTNWKYYEFNVAVPGAAVNNITMNFTIPTSFELVQCIFFCDGANFTYSSNITDVTRYGEPVILRAGTFTQSPLWANATFHIFFEETVLDVWEQDDAIYVEVSYDGGYYYLADGSLFRIYSKGGFSQGTASSNSSSAWILPGGTPFSFHVEDDGLGGGSEIYMYNDIWFRDVQHLKLLPEIHFLTGLDGFDIRYGCDYSFGDGWQTGWYFDINPDVVHYNGLFTAAVWTNFTVYFCDRDGIVSWEDLYMFNHGSITGVGDPGWWEMYVDLWISDVNASSVGAGRVNAYEYPMEDLGDLWIRWLTSNWAPMDDVFKEWSGMVPILASDDTRIMSSESVVMWRYWSRVQVYSSAGGQVIEVRNFEQFDDTRSQTLPLTGISTPVFDETITPVVGQKGLLGALFTMFASIGSFLGENVIFGGLNLWGTFVNFLDSIAAMFGAPMFFTNLFTWIGEMIAYLGTSIGYIGTLLTSLFLLFGSLLGIFLTQIADLVLSLITTLEYFGDMMGGAYGVGVNVWEDLGILTWIQVAMIFYPLYLVILWDDQGDAAVINHLTFVFGLLSWAFWFFIGLVQFVIGMITSVIESIPIAE